MSRKSIYLASQKKSEYRQNFLPFDYYDFCITAKENENLRCRNKLRDYLHTPFDWDEDLDVYIEPVNDNNLNQSTQTQNTQRQQTSRPTLYNPNEELERIIRHRDSIYNDLVNDAQIEAKNIKNEKKVKKNKKNNDKAKKNENLDSEFKKNDFKNNGVHMNDNTNNFATSPRIVKPVLKRSQSTCLKTLEKSQITPAQLAKEIQSKKNGNFELLKNSANQSIQTPVDWTLRNYHNKKQPNQSNLRRSVSSANIKQKNQGQPPVKPPPFAMYGSGVKTKDMSFKPTHNTLANKTLAKNHDKDALIELALQRLKKEANYMANEYSTIESASSEKIRTGRSESRGWGSEYDERYPDHSRSTSRKEIYYKENPYRLNKSTLNMEYPMLKRGPSGGKKKIYFYD